VGATQRSRAMANGKKKKDGEFSFLILIFEEQQVENMQLG
jgi:hypothetical protein